MSFKRFVLLVSLLLILTKVDSYKILVIFPSTSYSHQIPQQAVSQGLANNGHHVTIISPNTFKTSNPNITQIDVSFLYDIWRTFDFSKGMSSFQFLHILTQITPLMMDKILSDISVQEILKNKNSKFDAVIVENLAYTAINAVAVHFNTTLIGMTTMEIPPLMHQTLGNPAHPVLHPTSFARVPDEPNFFGKCKAVYMYLVFYYWMHYDYLPAQDWVIMKHFNIGLNSEQSMRKIDFAIEGVIPELGNTRPILPNTVQISFLHVKPVKELPKNLKDYLDGSKNGVVYVSFGSNVKSASLSAEMHQILLNTFRNLKYDILWKFENDTLNAKPDNVKIEKWLPQQDLLGKF